jgi:hypothetical protein
MSKQGWMSGGPWWVADVRAVPSIARQSSQTALAGSTIWAWPSLGSVDFASTVGMIGRIRRPMSTTRCVCAVMRTEKEGVLYRALVKQVGPDWRVVAAELRRWISGRCEFDDGR